MKAKENINYRTSIGKPAENYFKMKYNLSFETEDDIEILAEMSIQDLIDYLLNSYEEPQKLDKQHLLNDLIIFKSHRDELEMNLKRKELATNIFASFITVVAAVFAVIFAVAKNIPCLFIAFAVVMLLSFLIILILLIKNINNKESEINKIKTVNNIIYILEEIKNEMINVDKNNCIDVFNSSEKTKTNVKNSSKKNKKDNKSKDL